MIKKDMMRKFFYKFQTAIIILVICFSVLLIKPNTPFVVSAATATLTINPDQAEGKSNTGVHDVSEDLYGIFFEDINHGADGGMSAELVCNQSFEYEYFWGTVIKETDHRWGIDTSTISKATRSVMEGNGSIGQNNPTYVRIVASNPGYRMYNTGFQGDSFSNRTTTGYNSADYGMSFIAGNTYEFSFFARNDASNPFVGNVDVYAESKDKQKLTSTGSISFTSSSRTTWKKYSVVITATTTKLGALYLDFQGAGAINFDFVSLMPTDAFGYKDTRYTGGKIKREIVEIFAQMNPKFLRFPGGCVAEGTRNWDNVYNWKNTVGSIENRKGTFNLWEYYQSYNIGFYEYFLMCEDLGMKAMPVVSAGLICQARMGVDGAVMHKYDSPSFKTEVVDMALHLIYFAKGSVNSPDPDEAYWAGVRAGLGHPEPFKLDYISLGNENWGTAFWNNFAAAMRELRNYKYDYYASNPTDMLEKWDIQIVCSTYTDCWGAEWNNSWKVINGGSATSATAAGLYKDCIADEHYYNTSSWYLNNVGRYKNYDRNGAKVFLGEYSANGDSVKNSLQSALAEAAFMTGLEQDSDLVVMASYAPFFGREKNSLWAANALWLNAKNIMRTPNYYVQKMFGANVGNKFIPASFSGSLSGSYQSITQDTVNKRFYVKLVNTSNTAHTVNINFSNVSDLRGYYTGEKMSHSNNQITNGLVNEYDGDVITNVSPMAIGKTTFSGTGTSYALPAYSVNVLVFPYGEAGTDDTLDYIKIGGKTIAGFESNKTSYNITVPYGTKNVPYMFVKPVDASAQVAINYASNINGTTTISVTPASGGTAKTYSISYTVSNQALDLFSSKAATITIEDTYTLSVEFPDSWKSTFAVAATAATAANARIDVVPNTDGKEFMITPLRVGNIVLELKNSGQVQETVSITVNDAALKTLALLSSKTANVTLSQTYKLKVDYPAGYEFTVAATSATAANATIEPDDLGNKLFTVTPIKTGSYVIQLKNGDTVVETVTLTITAASTASYELISEKTPSITLSETYTLKVDYPTGWNITVAATAESEDKGMITAVYGKNNREFLIEPLKAGMYVIEIKKGTELLDTITVTITDPNAGGGNEEVKKKCGGAVMGGEDIIYFGGGLTLLLIGLIVLKKRKRLSK